MLHPSNGESWFDNYFLAETYISLFSDYPKSIFDLFSEFKNKFKFLTCLCLIFDYNRDFFDSQNDFAQKWLLIRVLAA